MARQKQAVNIRRRVISVVLWFLQEFTYRGRTIVLAAVLLTSLAAITTWAWQSWQNHISRQPGYALSPEQIVVTPPPYWLLADVVNQSLTDAGLTQYLSVLDDQLTDRLVEAFELHPWVRRVARVHKRFPARVDVELEYRIPVVAVGIYQQENSLLCPVDSEAIRLPAADVPTTITARLPRVIDVQQAPLVGQPFDSPRAVAGIALAKWLSKHWNDLHLLHVVPSRQPEIRGEDRYFLCDIVATGGTRIHWGAAPGQGGDKESTSNSKLARLRQYIAENTTLDTIQSPAAIDVRSQLQVTPRVANR